MTSVERPNDVTTTYTYGNTNTVVDVPNGYTENPYQVYEIDHSHANNGLISQYDYQYDAVGNRTQMDISTSTTTDTYNYTYDDAYRMIEEAQALMGNATVSTTYQYDRAGNRTTMTAFTRYSRCHQPFMR